MTDEQLIEQIEPALAALKAGDGTALDRLRDLLNQPDISVGDITGSTAVAIGSDIRITIRQTELPDDVVGRLIALADALDRQAEGTFEARGHVRVFLSSPGDVADERKLAMKAISKLQNDPIYKEKITIETVAWDKPDDSTPLLASIDPQTAINNGLARPSDCDIVVVILWSRMGTPLDHSRYKKPDGGQYLSGTEWEFEEALAAAQKTGRPFVVVYWRMDTPKVDLDDPDLEEKIVQRGRVKAFFDSFVNPDGSIRQGYNSYTSPTEFGDIFELHLRKLVARLIDEGQRRGERREVGIDTVNIVPPVTWPPGVSPFPGLRAFGPEDAPIYFGRGTETDKLVKRLSEPDCRFLAVVGASGSGKSSLVGAGLIPRLAENAIEGSRDWPVVTFTPDEWGVGDPFDSLAGALIADPLRLNSRGLASSLRTQPDNLREVLVQALNGAPGWAKALIFIDQFEELFTRVQDEALRRAFAAMLAETAQSPRIKTVITMRADFFHRVAELPALAGLLKAHENRTFPLSAPGSIDLYEMITGPARVAGLQFESGLAQQILYDTGDDPGALALMAYALQQLYEEAMDAPSPLAPRPSPLAPLPEGEGNRGERYREMATQAMRDAARELRQRQTDAETVLWECLRNRRLGGLKFRRQHPLPNTHYVVDFFNYESGLVVEIDGPIHEVRQAEDQARQQDIEALGYRVIRFSNNQVLHDLQAVLLAILSHAAPHAAQEQIPLPEGEGFRVRALTWRAYEGFGGVQGAIGEQAKDAFERLSKPAQDALPVVFRELVEVDERGTATRKRAPLSSVVCDAACEELVQALTNARLLMTSGGEYPVVEVAHEALFRSWPRLKAWIDEAQDDLILLRQVRAAADEWERKGQPDYLRWPAERLELVYKMQERQQPRLSEMEQDFIEPEQARLLREIADIRTGHQRRRWIGERLATIGDTRTGIGLDERGLPQIDWLPVAPGGEIEFEAQRFAVWPFYVARYLITHRQFQAFLDAPDGFEDGRWWKDFPQEFVRQQMLAATQQYDNYPRDSVSWYQCVAFTRWLDFKYREHGLFDLLPPLPSPLAPLPQGEGKRGGGLRGEGWQVRLPTEWEWQWMAQNGVEARQYPWGDWDGHPRANTTEAGIGDRSTAVGMYPHGAAACGALDVAGNLWEWCLNDYGNPQVVDGFGNGGTKVLRGGAFYCDQSNAACANRIDSSPHFRHNFFGVRVVVGPLSLRL